MRTVNTLEEARAALQSGAHDLESPLYAACHAGVNMYRALVSQLAVEFPDKAYTFTLCCGDNPAIAHDALRLGFKRIRLRCSEVIGMQLQEIAAQCSAEILLTGNA